jgi:putative ABC transport system permease protein
MPCASSRAGTTMPDPPAGSRGRPLATARATRSAGARGEPIPSPDWPAEVRERLSTLRLSPVRAIEIVEELSQHLEDRWRDLLSEGLDPEEARRAAIADFAGDDVLARRMAPLRQAGWQRPADVEGIMNDLRMATRRLTTHPAATLAAVLTLALAIGAAAAAWSLLSAVLLRPLPVAGADSVMVVGWREPRTTSVINSHNYPAYELVRDSGVFSGVAAGGRERLLVGPRERPVRTHVYFTSYDFLSVLGVPVVLGRHFTPGDDRRGAPLVALLSDRYWRHALNSDPQVVGRTLTVAGKPATVIGVVARGFRGLDLSWAPDLYMPLHTVADVGSAMTNYFAEPIGGTVVSSPTAWITIVGRLRPGMSAATAAARLRALDEQEVSQRAGGLEARAKPGREGVLTPVNVAAIPEAARAGAERFSRLLATTVGLLLLIGCATVGMLLLIRTEARREEFGLALALGASRARLARGIVFEGALLACAGAALALPVSHWLFAGLRTFELPGGVAIELLELTLDGRALLAAAACAVAATLLISAIAARFGFAADIASALHGGSAATRPRAGRRTRTLLVAGQVAVTMVLLAGAGVFGRSVVAALRVNPGFETARIVSVPIFLLPYGYAADRASLLFGNLLDRLRADPVVQSASLTLPQGGMTPTGRLVIDGEPRRFPSTVSFNAIDQRYFATVGVPIVEGRDFSDQDRDGTTRVAIVSSSFARRLAHGGSALGRRMTMPFSRPGQPSDVLQVVGVVPDLITNVSILEPLVMYWPIAQTPPAVYGTIILRTTNTDAARRHTLDALRQLDRAIAPEPMLTIEDRLAQQMAPQQFGAFVMGALGLIAIVLTVLGAYVMAESMAASRRRELGIRAALGARRWRLGGLVVAQTGRLVGTGLVIGLGLAWAGASMIRAFLFRVEPLDPATLIGVGALILVCTFAVTVRPAIRAARVDLVRVLRQE